MIEFARTNLWNDRPQSSNWFLRSESRTCWLAAREPQEAHTFRFPPLITRSPDRDYVCCIRASESACSFSSSLARLTIPTVGGIDELSTSADWDCVGSGRRYCAKNPQTPTGTPSVLVARSYGANSPPTTLALDALSVSAVLPLQEFPHGRRPDGRAGSPPAGTDVAESPAAQATSRANPATSLGGPTQPHFTI